MSDEENSKADLRRIQEFLGVSNVPDEYHDKVEGSCQWIDERDDFKAWRDATEKLDKTSHKNYSPRIYWVSASPGAGKTVLAAYVKSQFDAIGLPHAVYHFHRGKKTLESLSGCLRSIAYQMAVSNGSVREVVAKVCLGGSAVDLDDARAIWAKVFTAGILQVCLLISIAYPELQLRIRDRMPAMVENSRR